MRNKISNRIICVIMALAMILSCFVITPGKVSAAVKTKRYTYKTVLGEKKRTGNLKSVSVNKALTKLTVKYKKGKKTLSKVFTITNKTKFYKVNLDDVEDSEKEATVKIKKKGFYPEFKRQLKGDDRTLPAEWIRLIIDAKGSEITKLLLRYYNEEEDEEEDEGEGDE